MDIYIKPKKKVRVIKRKTVYIKDICDVFVSKGNFQNIVSIPVININSDTDCERVISVMDIVKAINSQYPDATISNLGETDTLIEYQIKDRKSSKFVEYAKVFFVCAVLLAGSATTIMSFHADAEIPEIFGSLYYFCFGNYIENSPLIVIPYTLGLGGGIIVFFNHFSKKYITKDPTPIEVQMTTYEKETIDSIIASLEKKEDKS